MSGVLLRRAAAGLHPESDGRHETSRPSSAGVPAVHRRRGGEPGRWAGRSPAALYRSESSHPPSGVRLRPLGSAAVRPGSQLSVPRDVRRSATGYDCSGRSTDVVRSGGRRWTTTACEGCQQFVDTGRDFNPLKLDSSNYYTLPCRPNLPLLISDIRALWRSWLSAGARMSKINK